MSQLNLMEILEAERLELKESQIVFGSRFDLEQNLYSRAKNGWSRLPERCISRVAEFLGIPEEDVQTMNLELAIKKPKKVIIERTRPTWFLSATFSRLSGFTQEEIDEWRMKIHAQEPRHIRAYLWDDFGCQHVNGDAYLECHEIEMGPEKLFAIMQAAIQAGAFGFRNEYKFVIVDYQGLVLYDGAREDPWAPWLRKRWAYQI